MNERIQWRNGFIQLWIAATAIWFAVNSTLALLVGPPYSLWVAIAIVPSVMLLLAIILLSWAITGSRK